MSSCDIPSLSSVQHLQPHLLRRRWLRGALVIVAAGAVSACGFKMRGDVSYTFTSVYINSGNVPALGADVRKLLGNVKNLKVVDAAKDAQVTLDLSKKSDDKSVLSLSSGGRAREYSLTQRLSFRLYDANGEDWMQPGEIEIQRTYLYDDSERLAREIQEQRILQEMQQDAAQQILRRLQRAVPPA